MTVLKHPLLISMWSEPLESSLRSLVDAQVARAKKCLAENKFSKYVQLHERPYQIDALLQFAGQIPTADEYWGLVSRIWIKAEFPHERLVEWQTAWTGQCTEFQAFRYLAMSKEGVECLRALPEEVPVYRGQELRHPFGISWSIDKDKAVWFAKRFQRYRNTPMCVVEGLVQKRDATALLLERGESELVIPDPSRVQVLAKHKV